LRVPASLLNRSEAFYYDQFEDWQHSGSRAGKLRHDPLQCGCPQGELARREVGGNEEDSMAISAVSRICGSSRISERRSQPGDVRGARSPERLTTAIERRSGSVPPQTGPVETGWQIERV
jgi:hypothetical protein